MREKKYLKVSSQYEFDVKSEKRFNLFHCLPAHRGEDIDDTILDSSHSAVWQQAHNRLYSSMALIDFLLSSSIN